MKKNNLLISSATGSAIGFVLGMMMILGLIMYQLLPVSMVKSFISSNIRNEVIAYNTAYAALQLQLLRFNIFFQVRAFAQSNKGNPIADVIGDSDDLIDPIWSQPFVYPLPDLPGLDIAQKETIKTFMEESPIKGEFTVEATGLGGKFNINDIYIGEPEITTINNDQNTPPDSGGQPTGGADPSVQQFTKIKEKIEKQIENIITQALQNKIDNDEAFKLAHENLRPEQVINAIKDYIDPDDERREGGSESAYYEKIGPQPANRPLVSISELHQIDYIDDSIYNIIAPLFRVAYTSGININSANKDFFMAILPGAKEEEVVELLKRRDDEEEGHGPWSDVKTFVKDLEETIRTFPEGAQKWVEELNAMGIEIVFKEEAFEIRATGTYAGTTRVIKAVILDNTQYELEGSSPASGTNNNNDNNNNNNRNNSRQGGSGEKKSKKVIQESLQRPPFIVTIEMN